jgi:hypothetical protein
MSRIREKVVKLPTRVKMSSRFGSFGGKEEMRIEKDCKRYGVGRSVDVRHGWNESLL